MAIDAALLSKPENRVLLLCARRTEKNSGFASVLGEVRDWEHLVSKLHFNRLSLLFLHHVQGYEALVPGEILQELQTEGEQILHWNLYLLAELQEVTRVLTEDSIRVLSYKGPALAFSAYNTLGLRRFLDLDLLISPIDRNKAVSILQDRGYRKIERKSLLSPYVKRQKRKIAYEVSLIAEDGFVELDIHWAVTAPFESFPLGFDHLWERRAEVNAISGVYSPCREDLIIALCFHGLKHGWEELEWVSCLLELIQNRSEGSLDWHYIESNFRSSGCQRVLHLGLRLADDLALMNSDCSVALNEVIPARLLQYLKNDGKIERMAREVWTYHLKGQGHGYRSSLIKFFRASFIQTSLGIRSRTGWKTKWKFICGSVSTSIVSLEHSKTLLLILRPLFTFGKKLFAPKVHLF